MNRKNPNIITFIETLALMGKLKISPPQNAILKSFYGLPLNDVELDIFKRGTARELYIPTEHSELTLIAGRQSGKTSVVAAPIAIFESFQDHGVPPGQRAYIFIIAPVIRQASIAFRSIRHYILNSPILSQCVLKTRKNEIELKNGVVIACLACSKGSVRGDPVICAILDEVAFFRHEDNSANPDHEVLDAIRPAMATLSNTKLIKISTAFRKEGIPWSEFQQRGQLPYYVWQLSSEELNPAIAKSFLDKARANEDTFRREHLAEFVDSNSGWIAPELLEPCIMHGCRELPRVSHGTYAAAIDPAFQSSDFGFAILHRSDRGDITVVCALRWTGTKKIHLNFEIVCEQIRVKLNEYGINNLVGDQYCFSMLKQHFAGLNIFYRESSIGTGTRASLFGNLRQLIIQRKIAIVDDPELLHQLRSLEEIRAANGNIDIRPARSSKDDVAIAVALAASELSEAVPDQCVPVILGGVNPIISPRYDAFGFPVGQECQRFPVCMENGNTCECFGC